MTVAIDPRHLADTLGIDLLELAHVQREWARECLDDVRASLGQDIAEEDRLAQFDYAVARARQFVEGAVVTEQAWEHDNPLDEADEDA